MYCGNSSDRGWSNLGGQSSGFGPSQGGFGRGGLGQGGFGGCGGSSRPSYGGGSNPFASGRGEPAGQGMGQGFLRLLEQMFGQGPGAGGQGCGGNMGQNAGFADGSTFDALRNRANFQNGSQFGSEPVPMGGQAADASQGAQATDSVQGGDVQSADDYAQHLNNERARHGLPPLRRNAQLDQAAQAHAQDLQGRRLSHTGSDGSSVSDRASRAGYNYRSIAENVASGQRSNAEVTQDWMNSPGHRRAMLDPNSTEFGFARVGDKFVLVMGSR